MTDNDIIKALDILNRMDFFQGQRAGRELWNDKPREIQDIDIATYVRDIKFLKDLINRQKAEIERLSADRYLLKEDGTMTILPRTDVTKIKAEAIKEFAERLKAESHYIDVSFLEGMEKWEDVVFTSAIDNLAKEMEGERE